MDLRSHLVVVVRLHEVRYATSSSWVQHLLAGLAVCCYHLMVVVLLLFLLEFVIECVELRTLGAVRRGEDCVYVLSERDLRAEAVHLVVVAAASRSNILCGSTFLLFAARWELVKVWSLLNHA